VLLPSPHQSWVVLISIYTNPLKGPVWTGPRTSPGPMRTGPKWSSPQSSLFLRFGGLVLVLVLQKRGSRTGLDWTLKHYLLPTSAKPGPHLTLNEFCLTYSLSNSVHQKLDENGHTTSNTITYICVSELKEMGFKHGEIAAMKDAVRQWAKV